MHLPRQADPVDIYVDHLHHGAVVATVRARECVTREDVPHPVLEEDVGAVVRFVAAEGIVREGEGTLMRTIPAVVPRIGVDVYRSALRGTSGSATAVAVSLGMAKGTYVAF